MTQEIEKQLSVPDPNHEYRDVPVTSTDGQARDHHIEINSILIRMLQSSLAEEHAPTIDFEHYAALPESDRRRTTVRRFLPSAFHPATPR